MSGLPKPGVTFKTYNEQRFHKMTTKESVFGVRLNIGLTKIEYWQRGA